LSTPLRGLRIGIFALAAAAIARPDDVTRLAQLVGIGRGADIVLYVLALAFVAVSFFLYAHQLRLRRDLSALAAHIAIGNARHGGAGGADERQAGDRVP
ncbi:MAG TPA: DUF2304 domain-containing protein, partial [Vicinamibacterales bacterium]|nr:DUF2304 domain-containing protein [Vicinamibacterales bacterium]